MSQVSRLAYAKAVANTAGDPIAWTGGAATTIIVPYDGAIRLTIAVGTASTLIIRYNSVSILLNSGVALAANTLYTFGFELPAGESFQVWLGTSATVVTATVDFVPGAVL